MLRKILTLFIFQGVFATAVYAQNFMEHIQKKTGKGEVTILQDARLDALVNGDKKYDATTKESEDAPLVAQPVKKIKARGYRIQVYWGGSSKTDESNARKAGNKIMTMFPEVQAYVTFSSPNWKCNVGDFANRTEANEFLKKLKQAKLSQNAMVVRSEVLIYKPQL